MLSESDLFIDLLPQLDKEHETIWKYFEDASKNEKIKLQAVDLIKDMVTYGEIDSKGKPYDTVLTV